MAAKSVALVAVLLLAQTSRAQMSLSERVTISFASAAEGKRILTRRDDFVERSSPFDRAARLKTDEVVPESRYLEFVGRNVLEWTDAEKRKVHAAFRGVAKTLQAMDLPFPDEVLLVKTTGNEEGGAAYTRANAIVLPKADLEAPAARIQKTICHELCHVLSRANPGLREKLYAAIGFAKCDEVAFPPELKSRKITNPDAPRNDHCIRVSVGGENRWAVPILYSSAKRYDVDRGGEFFDYLRFELLLVERPDEGTTVVPILEDGRSKLVGVERVSGFFEQVGKNTGYIIHPEEILADNFALLVLGRRDLPSPEVIEKIRAILDDAKGASADADERHR